MEQDHLRSGLAPLDYRDSRERIPEHAFWTMIDHCSRREGLEEIGLHVAGTTDLDHSGLPELLVNPTSGWAALSTFCRLQNGLAPHPHYYMLRNGDDSWICRGSQHYDACSRDIEYFSVIRLAEIVGKVTGNPFSPAVVELQSADAGSLPDYHEFRNTRFITNCNETRISIPHFLLLFPVKTVIYRNKFLLSVRKLLRTMNDSSESVSVPALASSCYLSTRSLQRRLEHENVSYRQLCDEIFYERAISLMQDPDITITEIAGRLGFPYPGNFTRTFKRISGVSPDQYRAGFLETA